MNQQSISRTAHPPLKSNHYYYGWEGGGKDVYRDQSCQLLLSYLFNSLKIFSRYTKVVQMGKLGTVETTMSGWATFFS